MGFSVLCYSTEPVHLLQGPVAQLPRGQEGRKETPSFLNTATHAADEHEGHKGFYVFLKSAIN